MNHIYLIKLILLSVPVFNHKNMVCLHIAQPHFAVVNCSDELVCVLLPCFNAQPDIFAVMNCCVVELGVFASDILIWSADSLYSVQ